MKFIILAVTFIAGLAAHAGDLADKKAWDFATSQMDEAAKRIEEKEYCGAGAKVTYTFDKASYKKGGDNIKYAPHCSQVLDSMRSFCYGNKDNTQAMLKAIKSISCRYDASLKTDKNHGLKIEKKGTVLAVAYNSESSNFDDEVKAFLNSNL